MKALHIKHVDNIGNKKKGHIRKDQNKSNAPSDTKAAVLNTTSTTTRKACTCLSTRHPFVTSCTGCGYILCEEDVDPVVLNKIKENSARDNNTLYSCPNCHIICLPPMNSETAQLYFPNDPKTIAAYAHKDKLLQYDREHAERTKVYDAQGDYYKSTTMDTHWLSEEERKHIERLEKQRIQRQLQPKHRTKKLNISFDVTGSKKATMVEVIDPYDNDADLEEEELEQQEKADLVARRGGTVIGGEGGGGQIICSPWLDTVDDDRRGSQNQGQYQTMPEDDDDEEAGGKDKKKQASSQLIENIELYKSNSIAGDIYRFLQKDRLLK